MTPKKPAKLRPDVAETAFRVLQEAVGEAPKTLPPSERTEKNADAVKRGRKGERKAARRDLTPSLRTSVQKWQRLLRRCGGGRTRTRLPLPVLPYRA